MRKVLESRKRSGPRAQGLASWNLYDRAEGEKAELTRFATSAAAPRFVDFLHRNNRLVDTAGYPVINNVGLAALTLLVAESDPKDKDILIRLIMHMIGTAPPTAEQA